MDPSVFAAQLAMNQAAYREHREEIRRSAPGYAAIAHGRLIVLTPTFDEAAAAVRRLQPPPDHFLVFPADEEPAFDLIDSF